MPRLPILLCLLLLPAALAPIPLHAAPAVLRVEVTGVRDANGTVRVALCTRETFLKDCPYHGTAAARPGTVIVTIPGVPPGVYAAQAFHDDNDSGVLERPLLGAPRKGFGFSRDAPMNWGPPEFADAAVSVGPAGGLVVVPLRYR